MRAASRVFVVVVGALGAACALPSQPAANTASTLSNTTAQPSHAATTGGEDVGTAELFVADMLAADICDRLRGTFVALPAEETPAAAPVTAAVSTPSLPAPASGRWWVRRCEARSLNGGILLSIGGPGWMWIDRESSGYLVRQYVTFEIDTELSARVTLGYDGGARVLSLWLTPNGAPRAQLEPVGPVRATPTGFFAEMIQGLVGADQAATDQVRRIGSEQLAARMGAGFTMTFNVGTRRVDFVLGALPRGIEPTRPYAEEAFVRTRLNESALIQPGGLDTSGRVDLTGGAALDAELQSGDGARIHVVCADRLERHFDLWLRGESRPGDAPLDAPIATLTRQGGTVHAAIPARTCPALLVVAPTNVSASNAVPVRVRFRVTDPPPATPNANPRAPAPSRFVRIQLAGVELTPRTADGDSWDAFGGQADPYAVVASVARGREVARTAPVADHNTATWNQWLPGAYDLDADFPLRLGVFDQDSMTDDEVGFAELRASELATVRGPLLLPLLTNETTPRRVGTLRLVIDRTP